MAGSSDVAASKAYAIEASRPWSSALGLDVAPRPLTAVVTHRGDRASAGHPVVGYRIIETDVLGDVVQRVSDTPAGRGIS